MRINSGKTLSQENRDKICMTGIYSLEPVLDWFPPEQRDNYERIHWCKNWTFKPYKDLDDNIVMCDTYYSTEPTIMVVLDDELFEKFKFEYDTTKVRKVTARDFDNYDEEVRYHLPIDSGGSSYNNNYFVNIDAKPSFHKKLNNIEREIIEAKQKLSWLEDNKKRLLEEMGNEDIKPKITPFAIGVPTEKELQGIGSYLRQSKEGYLLKTGTPEVKYMNRNGLVETASVNRYYAVRPILYFPKEQTRYDENNIVYNPGKENEISFTVINDGMALCDKTVGTIPFMEHGLSPEYKAQEYLYQTFLDTYGIELNGVQELCKEAEEDLDR